MLVQIHYLLFFMSRRKYKRRVQKEVKRDFNTDVFSKVSPETKKAILVFCILMISFLSFLALFNLSGKLGEYMIKGMRWIMGWLYFILPFLLMILGYILLNPKKYIIHFRHYLGISLLLLSATGFLNLIISSKDVFDQILLGKGGGYLGVPFYWMFFQLAGFWGAMVIILGMFAISIFLLFSLTLQDLHLGEKLRSMFSARRDRIDENGNDESILKNVDQDSEGIEPPESDLQKRAETPRDLTQKESRLKKLFPPVVKKVYKDIKIPLDLLSDQKTSPVSRDVDTSKEKIKRTFANFGINVEMGEVNVGPAVAQFTMKPDENVRLSKILALQDNLALSLAAHPIRIEAPIPGKSLVGIEVPNKVISTVRMKEILGDSVFKKSDGHLVFALGKDVSGTNHVVDLVKMPHLLIAGATGSGKSVCVNTIIISLLYRLNPNELKLILVDPKRVELSPYNGIPHLLTPVITKVDKTINALKWAVSEMDRRYDLLSKVNKKDIFMYNSSVSRVEDKLPQIVIIIDELADLMAVAAQDVENAIIRLAQMARAIGIHLVLATQRPSVNVITGLIKANITSRIAFSVASQIDSRTILDTSGAEKLLGRGDMLFICAEISKPRRIQGTFVSEQEKERIIEFLKNQAEPDYLNDVTEFGEHTVGFASSGGGDADSLLEEAKKIVVKYDTASATMLQRRLRIGYARGARILDQLEELGFVGPANGPKPREVLVTEDEFIRMGSNISSTSGVLPYSQADDRSYEEEEGVEDEEVDIQEGDYDDEIPDVNEKLLVEEDVLEIEDDIEEEREEFDIDVEKEKQDERF